MLGSTVVLVFETGSVEASKMQKQETSEKILMGKSAETISWQSHQGDQIDVYEHKVSKSCMVSAVKDFTDEHINVIKSLDVANRELVTTLSTKVRLLNY